MKSQETKHRSVGDGRALPTQNSYAERLRTPVVHGGHVSARRYTQDPPTNVTVNFVPQEVRCELVKVLVGDVWALRDRLSVEKRTRAHTTHGGRMEGL